MESHVDLIIGIPKIQRLNLFWHIPSRFFSGGCLTKMLTGLGPVEKTSVALEEKVGRVSNLSFESPTQTDSIRVATEAWDLASRA